jgi:plastocyanin
MLLATGALAQDATVRGKVTVLHHSKNEAGSSNVVVWLTPVGVSAAVRPGPVARLVQKNKEFTPHVLAITAGTTIEFPNRDPFFHDVFSIYHGKPFDLGLYESGATRKVAFTKPGLSYIFCNIHPEMSAIVLVMRTPYFSITDISGSFQISGVPRERYKVEFWYDAASEAELAGLSREMEIAGDEVLPPVTLRSYPPKGHLNKYGEPYTPEKNKY